MQVQLAQYNIATLALPLEHPQSATYAALLDEVNALAEASPGFVWRHGIDSRDSSTSVYDDPLTLVNMSVWETPAHLRDYAYRGFHRDVFRRRQEWFVGSGAVMWWIPAGTIPTIAEGVQRLEFLRAHGPTPYGFGTGQQVEQLVIVERDAHDPEVSSLLDGDRVEGIVQVAFVDGVATAAARHMGDDVVSWVRAGAGREWLLPAMQVHSRLVGG